MEPTTNQSAQLEARLQQLEQKIDAVYKSAETTRKILLWTGIITVAAIVLPLIGLVFAIPSFLKQFADIQSLGL
ncbi:MAG: hypothetical protein RL094_505 [Candidatus Parcubacteria bacterium]|jgi:type II secretory pathway component PulM